MSRTRRYSDDRHDPVYIDKGIIVAHNNSSGAGMAGYVPAPYRHGFGSVQENDGLFVTAFTGLWK